MADLSTTYTFRIDIEGAAAIQKAAAIRQQLEAALKGTVQGGSELQKSLKETNDELKVQNVNLPKWLLNMRDAKDASLKAAQSVQQHTQSLQKSSTAIAQTSQSTRVAQRSMEELSAVWTGKVGMMEFMFSKFASAVNEGTIKFFGVRRLGYAIKDAAREVETAANQIVFALEKMSKSYLTLNDVATYAALAMELPASMQTTFERQIMDTAAALGMFKTEEIAQSTRTWAAGIGTTVDSQEELNKIMKDSIGLQKLAKINAADLGNTTTNVGGTIQALGMSYDDLDTVLAVFNWTAAKTFAQLDDIGESFKMLGPYAANFGEDVYSLSAQMGILAQNNIRGTMAGRALRQIYLGLGESSKEVDESMNSLLNVSGELGNSWRDIMFPEGEFVGFAKYIDILAANLEGLNQQQRTQFIATTFDANAIPAVTAMINAQIEARKRNFNILSAMEKEARGVYDAEVEAYQTFIQQTRGIEPTLENAFSLWDQQTARIEESNSVRAQKVAASWKNAGLAIGEAWTSQYLPVAEEAARIADKAAREIAKVPELTAIAGIIGYGGVVAGRIGQLVGSLLGMVANYFIFKVAVTTFAGSVSTFSAAVAAFAVKNAVDVPANISQGLASMATAQKIGSWIGRAFSVAAKASLLAVAATIGTLAGAALIKYITPELYKNNPYTRDEPGLGLKGYAQEVKDIGAIITYALAEAIGWFVEQIINAVRLLQEGLNLLPGVDIDTSWAETSIKNLHDTLKNFQKAAVDAARTKVTIDITDAKAKAQEIITKFNSLASLASKPMRILFKVDYIVQASGGSFMLDDNAKEAIKLWEDYSDQVTDVHNEYAREVGNIERSFQQDMEKSRRDYYKRLAQAAEDFALEEARALEEHMRNLQNLWDGYQDKLADIDSRYNERISDMDRDYNEERLREEEDYQKRMERLRLDHVDRMHSLIVSRDARGILDERRSYARRVREEEEDHRDSVGRRQEDYERERREAADEREKARAEARADYEKALADAIRSWEEQERRRRQDYERRRAREAQEWEEWKSERSQQRKDDLTDARLNANMLLRQLSDDYADQLGALRGYHTDDERERNEHYRRVLEDLDRFLADYYNRLNSIPDYRLPSPSAPNTIPHGYIEGAYASGGYVSNGVYRMGELGREFVLNAASTSALERYVGKLDQDKVVSMARNSTVGGGVSISVKQDNWRFQGSFTSADKAWFRDAAREAAYEAIVDVVRG